MQCTVQEAVYHILSQLKLRKVVLDVYFVHTNPSEERVQVLLSEKELSVLPDDSPNVFKKQNIDYLERPRGYWFLLRRTSTILHT